GDPIAQAQAPALINPLLKQAGSAVRVIGLRVAAAGFAPFVAAMQHVGNLRGLIVTLPHKPEAFRLATHTSDLAQIGAVANALRWDAQGRLHGDIFDGLGLAHALARQAGGAQPSAVYLHGAGGVGAAIAAALASQGVRNWRIHDSDAARAQALAARLVRRFGSQADVVPAGQFGDAGLLVNASPQGMHEGDALPFSPPAEGGRTVADVVMREGDTPLLRAAAASGHRVVTGQALLAGQVPLLLDFFGVTGVQA
ncbi:MAG: shikimate dehydrogenase, partial [Comamonadaceae bacterium]